MQQQFATPGGDAGGPPPSKETTQSRQEEEANAKVLHVEQAAERLLREQQEHHQQEIAAYLKQAQAGHDILKRQESRAITQRDEAIEAIRVRSVGEEEAAKQAVQHLESQQAKLMQQENAQVYAKTELGTELEAAKANAKQEAEAFAKSQSEQHRLSQQRFQQEETRLVSELQAHQANQEAQIVRQVAYEREELLKAEQRVRNVATEEQAMSRALKQEFDVTVRMTQSEAGVSEERIARMRNELSQQALYFQQREQELQQQMSQVVHGVRAQAQGEVAQAAQQAAEATSAARVEAAQAVAWRLAQPRRNMEGGSFVVSVCNRRQDGSAFECGQRMYAADGRRRAEHGGEQKGARPDHDEQDQQ